MALVRYPLTPRQIHTSCLWTMIDRTGPLESTSVLIMLGFMTFGVWHERDSGIAEEQEIWAIFSKERPQNELKVVNYAPFFFQSVGYLIKLDIFVMELKVLGKSVGG